MGNCQGANFPIKMLPPQMTAVSTNSCFPLSYISQFPYTVLLQQIKSSFGNSQSIKIKKVIANFKFSFFVWNYLSMTVQQTMVVPLSPLHNLLVRTKFLPPGWQRRCNLLHLIRLPGERCLEYWRVKFFLLFNQFENAEGTARLVEILFFAFYTSLLLVPVLNKLS